MFGAACTYSPAASRRRSRRTSPASALLGANGTLRAVALVVGLSSTRRRRACHVAAMPIWCCLPDPLLVLQPRACWRPSRGRRPPTPLPVHASNEFLIRPSLPPLQPRACWRTSRRRRRSASRSGRWCCKRCRAGQTSRRASRCRGRAWGVFSQCWALVVCGRSLLLKQVAGPHPCSLASHPPCAPPTLHPSFTPGTPATPVPLRIRPALLQHTRTPGLLPPLCRRT